MLMRVVAAVQAALIAPAALFLASVLVGTGDPPQYELAHVAHRIVAAYAGRGWTLWLLLLALPGGALLSGSAALAQSGVRPATLAVAGATVAAAGILAVVVLHTLAN